MKPSDFPVTAFEANTFSLEPGIRLLEASAGTGKTFALAQLVLRLVGEAQLKLGQLLVVTFTDAAAAELRDRIGQRLQQALACLEDPNLAPPDPVLASWLEGITHPSGDPQSHTLRARLLLALEELDSADITTIHGFCRRTLQRQALEAGLAPDLQLDQDSGPLIRQIAHDYWLQQVLVLPLHLLEGVTSRVKGPECLEQLLGQLDGDPALQLDPLPTGWQADSPLPPQLEALWQANWQDLRQRWQQQGAALEDNLRAAAGEWREQGAKSTTPYSPKPIKNRWELLNQWITTQGEQGDYGATTTQELLSQYFHPGAFLKVARPIESGFPNGQPGPGPGRLRDPSLPQASLMEAIAAVVEGPAEAVVLHACHWGRSQLQQRRQRRHQLGFSQLLEGLDPGGKASTPLLEAVGERYGAALIDEFQDTDPIQWRILSRAFQPHRHRLVMVGDPKQAIYRFRGGELATYLRARATAGAGGGISSLGDNYRAAAGLIQALNGLMAPGLRRSNLPVPPVVAKANKGSLALAEGRTPVQLLWLGSERPAGAKAPSRSQVEQTLPDQIAAHTAQLLNQGLVLEREGHQEVLKPKDVCLLVSTHGQAEALRSALEQVGIASRLVSKGDVLESAGATALQRFLDALADPASTNRLRLLAASPLMGWSPDQLIAATPSVWAELADRLSALAEQLPRRGLLGVLGSLLGSQNLAQLALDGRLLADLQQSAELVQACLHTEHLGPAAAADWLRRRRLDPDRHVPEAHQPHSDAVDQAVAVVTVHRSKGLEYPVVICPYLWQAPSGQGPGAQRLGVRWHPQAEPVLDLHLNRHWGQGYAAQHQQLNAELQERERLAYVAVTRAMHLLVLAWGPAHGQQGNPLHPWLFSEEPPPAVGPGAACPYASRSDGEWRTLLERSISERRLPLEVLEPPPAGPGGRGEGVRFQPPATPQPHLGRGPVPQGSFDTSWGRSSYTSWTQGSHGASPRALEEGRETDDVSADAIGRDSKPALEPQAAGWRDQGPLALFPRGANAGDCLHRILEHIDYQAGADSPETMARVERELQRSGIATDQSEAVLLGIHDLLTTPLGGPLGQMQLQSVQPEERLHELNFDLTLDQVHAKGLAAAFANHPSSSFGAPYAASLADLAVASRGFLTGSIDLVFRASGADGTQRWWIADWKSNWLGERDPAGKPLCCGPKHYTQAAMAELMAANHYPLQAHLYLVALHRYLNWRLGDYNPARDLGGYAYLFLRGVPGNNQQARACAQRLAPVPGVFIEQPPLERLLALNRALGGLPGQEPVARAA